MRENVVRALTRWGDTASTTSAARGPVTGFELAPFLQVSAFYKPRRDEPLVALVIPPEIVAYLSISIMIHRHDREIDAESTLLGDVPAVVFSGNSNNRVPFHGNTDERDEYEVKFLNTFISTIYVTAAVLVYQP